MSTDVSKLPVLDDLIRAVNTERGAPADNAARTVQEWLASEETETMMTDLIKRLVGVCGSATAARRIIAALTGLPERVP